MELPVHTLPEGYTFNETEMLTLDQVSVLYYPKFTDPVEIQYLTNAYNHIDNRNRERGVQAVYMSVQNALGDMIGVGCVKHVSEAAELCNFAVMPEHRSLGIGKWIIVERLRRARELGVKTVYIPELAATNTLATFYAQLSFQKCDVFEAGKDFYLKALSHRKPYVMLNF